MKAKMRNYNLKYVFTERKGIIFRLRIYLAERLIPKSLNFYGREKVIGYIDKSGRITTKHCGHARATQPKEKEDETDE